MHDCEEQFEDSLKAENKLHKKNLRKCKGGHGDGDGDGDGDNDDDDLKAGGGPGSSGVTDGDHHRYRRKDSACIAEELARHKAAVARIEEGERQCIASCHHQGGGSGR